jgi:hypothetical protein
MVKDLFDEPVQNTDWAIEKDGLFLLSFGVENIVLVDFKDMRIFAMKYTKTKELA